MMQELDLVWVSVFREGWRRAGIMTPNKVCAIKDGDDDKNSGRMARHNRHRSLHPSTCQSSIPCGPA